MVKTHQKIVSGILVDHLLKHRLITSSLRLQLLHKLSLGNQPFLDQELYQGVCLCKVEVALYMRSLVIRLLL